MLGLWDDIWGFGPRLWVSPWRRWDLGGYNAYPPLNLYGNEEKLVITSELPGINPDDLQISVQGRTLTIKGKRDLPELGEEECYICHERSHGEFQRTVTLPYEVEADKVEASYEDGVLTLTLPRVEREKPRKIEVKAA